MLDDRQLQGLLEEAAGGFPLPEEGAAEVRRALLAAQTAPKGRVEGPGPASSPRPRRLAERRRRWTVTGGAVAVAAGAAAVALVLTGPGASAPPPIAAGTPAARAALPGDTRLLTPASGGAASSPAHASGASSSSGPSASTGRQIVATGTLDLWVVRGHLAGDVGRLESLTSSLGGYVQNAQVREQGAGQGGTLVLAVPAGRFSALTSGASRVGRLQSLTTTDRDVTGQVVDVAAQLSALQDARRRLETLAARAGTVASLLQVENAITSTETQIEQLQGEQRALAAQVSDARLSVDLHVARPRPPRRPGGFSRAWHDAVDGFLAAVRGLVAASGPLLFALLAVAALALLAWFPGRRSWRALRRRRL